jgi:FkbM family methyltransferase
MYAKSLLRGLQQWGYSNDFLRNIWRTLVPAGLRGRFTLFTTGRDIRLKLKALSPAVIRDIEDKTASFDKAGEALAFLKANPSGMASSDFVKIWLEQRPGGEQIFNFNGAYLPYPKESALADNLYTIFADSFLFHTIYNDDYDSALVKRLEKNMPEGPYGYTDGGFDVSVKPGDVVIDAGAFIGDFGAYAAARGALAYAFEPVKVIFEMLKKTAELNGGRIKPIQKGLGNSVCETEMFVNDDFAGGSTLNPVQGGAGGRRANTETIFITTLDAFAESEKLEKIDFIKADIEGAERDMLRGATRVLKEFAPKLAICTYHLPDDPQVLERLILEANPRYKVRQGPMKLYAAIGGNP